MDVDYQRDIEYYYEKSAWLYRLFWYNRENLGMHYGLWKEGTRTHAEAVLNQYREVIKRGKIRRGMEVLDAGCGVGGGAVYVARETGARVTGITITKSQIQEARANAVRAGVAKRVRFVYGDYLKTGLPWGNFDVVYAIESACYAWPKRKFAREMYKLLKPGGRLVIADGYRRREEENEEERKIIREFCRGWRLKELTLYEEMTNAIKGAGFEEVKADEVTSWVVPNFGRMKLLVALARPVVWLAKVLAWRGVEMIVDNASSMEMGWRGVERGLGGYYIHTATKPGS